MAQEVNIEQFAKSLRERRGKMGLREVADEIGGISASTLSRLEKGNIPDLDTFVRVCRWLGVSHETFIKGGIRKPSNDNLDEDSRKKLITAHLRADKKLDTKTAQALVRMIELAYEQAERDDSKSGS